MRKIPSLFIRDFLDDHTAIAFNSVTAGCEWVLHGEGICTLKWDGQAVLIQEGQLFRRYDRKIKDRKVLKDIQAGIKPISELTVADFKVPPAGWTPCEPSWDLVTAHWPGWTPVSENSPADKYMVEAFAQVRKEDRFDGTYEFVGPTVNANPHGLAKHGFIRHADQELAFVPRDFDGLKEWFSAHSLEGLVWHHPDGRAAKLHRSAMGGVWPDASTSFTQTLIQLKQNHGHAFV